MLSAMPIQFEQPAWLLLLLLLIPVFMISRRSIGAMSREKARWTFALRALVIILLASALSHPGWNRVGESVTTFIILDRSHSIPQPLQRASVEYLRQAIEAKQRPEDRVGVILAGAEPVILAMPHKNSNVPEVFDEPVDRDATNLEDAVSLALASMPPDTANRIVIVSDGNETNGNVLAAADLAKANDVSIDVLMLKYEHVNEVIFERLDVPARARPGQTANVKMVIHSQASISGTIRLTMNGEPVDLDPEGPSLGMHTTLEPGRNFRSIPFVFDRPGPVELDATFEPDDGATDRVDANNRALGVTFVGGEGKVLIIDAGSTESQYLAQALRESQIAVDVLQPDALERGSVFLNGYDAVVLANIPRVAITDEEDLLLHNYVHDLSGGLIMLGGQYSFGAGGWMSSVLKDALPVTLDPPESRQMVRGALALIMHSCEMPQGNFWGQKVAESAIEALSAEDYVGIIVYSAGVEWAHQMKKAGDKTAAVAAAKRMNIGDMPDFGTSMQMALQGLRPLVAGNKHVIIISDGDAQGPPVGLLDDYVAAGITVSTVMVAGHGMPVHKRMMEKIALYTEGRPYLVKDPTKLPEIFIKEAQIVARSLIVEGDVFQPVVAPSPMGPIEGFNAVPAVDGYVLVVARDGFAQTPIVSPTTEGNDPIYAYWNYGLGKTVAYTSDLTGRWGSRWVTWSDFRAFWARTVRWSMRSPAPPNIIVRKSLEGDVATIEVEALGADASHLNFLALNMVVLGPDGEALSGELQQTGPGRYKGQFKVREAGAYQVNVSVTGGAADNPMRGNLQVAVTVPYPREFRDVTHNAATLTKLAERTGGRVLLDDPQLADLFYRQNLQMPKSAQQTWDLLAILAAVLFVFDVAARRLAIDRRAVREAARRVVGKRGEVGTDTVAAWKRTRAAVSHGREKSAEKAASAPDGSARFEADEGNAAHAIDVGAESSGEPTVGLKATEPPEKPKQPDADDDDQGGYTSRLLAAKRRARGEEDDTQGGATDA